MGSDVTPPDYESLLSSLKETVASTAREVDKVHAEIDAERQSYRNLFKYAKEGYFVTGLDGIIREVNISGSNLLGIVETELIGKRLSSYVRLQDQGKFHAHVAELNESKKFHNWETVFIHNLNREVLAEVTVSVVHVHPGNISGLRWLVNDITQHRQMEERLRRNTGQLVESQKVGHVGSWERDLKTNEVTWSDEMYRIFGLEPQSVRMNYESFLAHIHPNDHEHMKKVIGDSIKSHQPFSTEYRAVQPNGSTRHVHSQGVVLLDDNGQPKRLVGTAQDVTEQRQTEEKLRRLNIELEQRVENRTHELSASNEQLNISLLERERNEESIKQLNIELKRRVDELQTIFNMLPVGVTVSYDSQATNTSINSTGQRILGIENSLDMPLPFTIMRDGKEVPLEERPLRRSMIQNVSVSDAELDLMHKDGGTLNLLAYASPLYDEQGQVRGGVSAYIDITKRKSMEKHLTLQYAIAHALAESKGISEASLKVLKAIGTGMGWAFGGFWIFDRDANKLYVESIWQKPGFSANELVDASRELQPAPGEALPGSVYLANQPLWLSAYGNQPNFPRKEAAEKGGLNSVVSFPLRSSENKVLGVMEFFSQYIQPPTYDQLDMLNAFANQVGEFMERKYVEDLHAAQMQQQSAIIQLSKQALLGNNLQELLDEACSLVSDTLSLEFSHVLEIMPEKRQVIFRAAAGWNDSIAIGGSFMDLEPDSQPVYVLSENQAVNILELSKETRFQIAPILKEHNVVSGMSVVISGRSRPFGLLEAYSTERRMFTTEDLNFLQSIAQVLAAAIQHREAEDALRLSRNQISVILGGIADGITAQNKYGQLIYANDAAAHTIGYANAEELIQTPVELITSKFELFDESGAPMNMSQMPGRLALRGEDSPPVTIRFKVLETGEEHWSIVRAQSVKNEAGEVVMAVNIFHDVTEIKHSELWQHLLAQTSQVLAQDLDYQTRLVNLANILVPRLADWCAIDLLDENEKLQRVAVVHPDPQMVEWAHELYERYPPDPNAPNGAYKVVRTNQAEYIPIFTKEMIEAVESEDARDLLRKLNISSAIVVPLSARGRGLGTLTLIWAESNHHYTEEDLAFTVELARRAALALDNARLYVQAQRLNAELEELVDMRTSQLETSNTRADKLEDVNQKMQREIFQTEIAGEELKSSLKKTRELYEISQTIGLVTTPNELLQALLSSSHLESTLRASIAIFNHVWEKNGPKPTSCMILTAWNKQPETSLHIGQEMTLEAYGVVEPYSRTEPLVLADIRMDPRVTDEMRERLLDLNVTGSILFPLVAGSQWYGMLSLHLDHVVSISSTDVQHLQALVDEVAMGIQNFRLLKAEARARREAEEANNLKMKFLGMISHELRTPLASIKGFSTTLLADDVEWNLENQRDFMEIISSEADKLSELIEQLLDVPRLAAGAIRIIPEPVDWYQIISRSEAQLKALTAHHHLIINKPKPDLPLLNIDATRISQVITNLVNNAAKYSPPDSTITIGIEKISDQFVQVRVTDEGMGIPPEQRKVIFEAFQQLDYEGARPPGAGLGLAICHGLVEAHGGSIWVDDAHLGKGTTMSFTLPIADH